MTMANEQNLKVIRDSELARALQEKSAKKRAENNLRRKTLAEELLAILSQGNIQEKISLAQIEKALKGDTKAYEVIRDTVGEKPTDRLETKGEQKIIVELQGDVAEWGK